MADCKVQVLGVYLGDQRNAISHIVRRLRRSCDCEVVQRWVSAGRPSSDPEVAAVTVRSAVRGTPKFQILQELLDRGDPSEFDFTIAVDDDIHLPANFLDRFLRLQQRLGFAIAQPARTPDSYLDHPIVVQQRGLLARQTRFVEIGPLVSFHRSAYDLVFPFDATSPMGWGYENVWAIQLAERGLKMGIIDCMPVEHSLRKPVAHYDWHQAHEQQQRLLNRTPHLPQEQCFSVLDAITFQSGRLLHQPLPEELHRPAVSVILPSFDSAALLARSLHVLANQDLGPKDFEVIVIDGGLGGESKGVCHWFSNRMKLRQIILEDSGEGASKNLGCFVSRGEIVLFLDVRSEPCKNLLRKHLDAHGSRPEETFGCIGPTDWTRRRGPYSIKRCFLVRHGGFKQHLDGGDEDRELLIRLSNFGFRARFQREAPQPISAPTRFEAAALEDSRIRP